MFGKIAVYASFMLLFGSISTISLKFQDVTKVGEQSDGSPMYFKHPAVQSCLMFIGEALCLIPHFLFTFRSSSSTGSNPNRKLSRQQKAARGSYYDFKKLLAFLLPAMCDATATTLLNIGLYYTYASTFQMLRGTLVLWAGLFTLLLVRRPLFIHHWMGMFFIAAGAAIVGAASILYRQPFAPPSPDYYGYYPPAPPPGPDQLNGSDMGSEMPNLPRGLHSVVERISAGFGMQLREDTGTPGAIAPLFGDTMIFLAQVFAALQFILEEKFLSKYRVPPLLAVGIEGMWGLALCTVALPALALVKTPDGVPIDDGVQAVKQIAASRQLQVAVATSILCIGVLNFFGLKVTRALSGASRATIDACRTLFVWAFSIWIGWETFHELQIVGFVVLISGTSLYNEVIQTCLPKPEPVASDSECSDEECDMDELEAGVSGEDTVKNALHMMGEDQEGEVGITQPLLAAGRQGSVPGDIPAPSRAHKGPVHHRLKQKEAYTMARSWMLGAHALSPKPLEMDPDEQEESPFPSEYDAVRGATPPSGQSSYMTSNSFLGDMSSSNMSNPGTDMSGEQAMPSTAMDAPGQQGVRGSRQGSGVLVGSLGLNWNASNAKPGGSGNGAGPSNK